MTSKPATTVETEFGPIVLTSDNFGSGRPITVLPNPLARELAEAATAGWYEYVGMADGHSRTYPANHRISRIVEAVWAAGSPPYAFLVGEAGWNFADSRWTSDRTTNVGPKPTRVSGGIRFSG